MKTNGMLKEWLNINHEISKGCVRSPWVFIDKCIRNIYGNVKGMLVRI